MAKNFFLISDLKLPSVSLKPLILVLLQQVRAKKLVPVFPIGPLKVLKDHNKVSPEPSRLQADQPQLSQPFLRGEVFNPCDHFCGPPLDPLQQLHVLLVLRVPELDTGLPVGSHQRGGMLSPGSSLRSTDVPLPFLYW